MSQITLILRRRSPKSRITGWSVGVVLMLGCLFALPTYAQLPVSIVISFRLDPWLIGGSYGGGFWVSPEVLGPVFVSGESFVIEVRAGAVDASGQSIAIVPTWTASHPEMVAVSPKGPSSALLTVQGPGQSTVDVSYLDACTQLAIDAVSVIQIAGLEIILTQSPDCASSNGGDPKTNPTAKAALIFAQFANGETPAGSAADGLQAGKLRNRTRVILRNNSDLPDAGFVRFSDGAGRLADVQIGGVSTQAVDFSLAPWSATEIETDGTGTLQTGTVEIVSHRGADSMLEGTEIFEILGHFVSVMASPPRESQQAYISVTDEENTGVALYNPDRGGPLALTLILLDSNGVEQVRKDVTLRAAEQMLGFVDETELFGDFFAARTGEFRGTLNIHTETGKTAAALGLLQKRTTGALIAVSTVDRAFQAP